jgi:predicted glutamine amidotransferase
VEVGLCRVLGLVSREGFSQEYLAQFRNLAENGRVRRGAEPGHKDGWGVVLHDGNIPIYLAREPKNASEDPKYLKVSKQLGKVDKGILLAHLRKATRNGGPPSVENTHPFVNDRWAFAHNGGITKFNIKPQGLEGITDSERLFRLLTNRIEKSRSFEDALAWSVSFVRKNFKYSSLNFVLSDGNVLYAYRDCVEAEDYYTMLYKQSKKEVVVSQETLDGGEWKSIPNRNLAVVRKDLSIQIQPLPSYQE